MKSKMKKGVKSVGKNLGLKGMSMMAQNSVSGLARGGTKAKKGKKKY